MKRILLALIAVVAFTTAYSQEKNDSSFVYCEIQQPSVGNDTRIVNIPYNENESKTRFKIKDDNGNILNFYNIYSAISHMELQGWKFVQLYTLKNENLLNTIRYAIMKKKVSYKEAEKYSKCEIK